MAKTWPRCAPFEIDFAAEPLARARVFAICGPTGAGKSTLLDAICLALFHTTPRLEAVSGHGADIPDTGDKTITSKDPRNMLSRGAGHGYAEVDFVGLDGRSWRARWEIHRARQKATGLLQQPKASLTALDDGTVVASQLREVQTRIGERIGLDFGQFTRAVMLPQNGFAEFLKAPERERADLLSALTGGEIYGRISKLAWDRADGFAKREEEIETRLGYEPPLNDLARADLEAREAAAAAELQTLDARLTTLATALAWYGKEAELTAAAEATAKAAAEHDKRATDEAEARRNLRRDERLAALRPRHDELATLRGRRRELAEGAPARQAALGAAETAHAAALALEQKAKADAQAARERRDAARPLRDRVRKLDEALTAATTGKLAAVDAHADAEEAKDAAAAAHAETAETLAAATAEAGRWPAWQAAHPALPADAKRWTKLGADLDTAAEEAAHRDTCDAELQTLAAQAQSGTAAVEAAKAKVAEAETAEQAAITALAAAEAALPADESAALAERRDALTTRRAGLDALTRLSADRARLRGEVEAAGLEVADLEYRHLTAATAAAKAEAALPALTAEHAAARQAHDRTRLTADEHTQALRATLVAGDPARSAAAPSTRRPATTSAP